MCNITLIRDKLSILRLKGCYMIDKGMANPEIKHIPCHKSKALEQVVQMVNSTLGNKLRGDIHKCNDLLSNETTLIMALLESLAPSEEIETAHCVQIVTGYILGMRALESTYKDDQNLGLKLLGFSNKVLCLMVKRRYDANNRS